MCRHVSTPYWLIYPQARQIAPAAPGKIWQWQHSSARWTSASLDPASASHERLAIVRLFCIYWQSGSHHFPFQKPFVMSGVPSGKRLHNYGKSPFLMGKSTISMAIFNSYVKLPEGSATSIHVPLQSPSGINIDISPLPTPSRSWLGSPFSMPIRHWSGLMVACNHSVQFSTT